MRKLLFLIIFIAVGLSYVFRLDKFIVEKFSFFNDIKLTYVNKIVDISSTVENHFNQVKTIEKLKKENIELREYKILYASAKEKLNRLEELITKLDTENLKPKIELVKVLSYINFNDFTQVWIDKKDIPENKILGLITENYAAGIVVNRNNRAVAILNGNKECSYAVYIGNNKTPGIITSSKDKKNMIIKYIPTQSEIFKGDEVITSGMDNIFFEGLKVGQITEITSYPDMKVAIVKPYANVLKKKFFYTYEDINTKQIKATN